MLGWMKPMSEARATVLAARRRRATLLCAASVALVLGMAAVARAAGPGSLDSSFGSGGIVSSGQGTRLFGTTVLSNGKVVAVGESGAGTSVGLLLVGLTASGALDPSFGSGGIVHGPAIADGPGSLARAVAAQSNGKLVVVGSATDSSGVYSHGLIVERYNANGTLDTSFGSRGVVEVLNGSSFGNGYALAIQPDGRIIATGSAQTTFGNGTAPRVAVVRLSANGRLDPSFGSGGMDVIDLGPYSLANSVAVQHDGKIVIAGSQSPGIQNAVVARLTTSGALDPSFAGSGVYGHQYAQGSGASAFNTIAVQGDGKIVAAGAAGNGESGADAFIARFTSSGAPDSRFGSGGVQFTPSAVNWSVGDTPLVPGAYGLLIAPNGDYVLAGTYANSVSTYATLWALRPGGAADTRFGQGGAAVLTNSDNINTEYAGLAPSPTNNDFVLVGDSAPFGGRFAGIAARYVGFGAPPPPPPPLRLTMRGARHTYSSSTVAGHGLKLTVTCNEACRLTVSLTASAATARHLHIARTVSSQRAALKKAGTKTFVLRLNRSLIRVLERQKSVGLTLVVSGTSTVAKRTQTIRSGVTFRR